MKLILQQLRPHQWLKNLLLFAPLVLAHRTGDADAWITLFAAFAAFSLTASAIYTINDLADIQADREHSSKRHRPLPSGLLTQRQAIGIILILMLIGGSLAYFRTSEQFLIWLLIYLVATSAYTFILKRIVLVDVFVLAGLYSLRIVAGAAAVDVRVSPWLLAFSLFLFTSLAFLKRYTELVDTVEREGRKVTGRGYHVGDADFVRMAGPTLGFMAVVIFVLYVNGPDASLLYDHPERLWFMVPLLLYWIARMWLNAYRGRMDDDPILFATKDVASYVVAILAIVIMQAAGPL